MYAVESTARTGRRFSPRAEELPPRRAAGRWLPGVLLLGALGWGGTAAAEEAAGGSRESWYRVDLGGEPAGWAMEREVRGDGEIVTESQLRLEIRRGQAVTVIEMESRFVESRDGRPVSAWTKQKLGAVPIETSYEFAGDDVIVRRRQAGETREQRLPAPGGDWLTPGRAQSRIRDGLASGAEELSMTTLDPLLGLEPITTRWVLEARDETVETALGTFRASRWRQTQSYAPQVATVAHVDAEGLTVASATSFLGMDMTLTLAEREALLGRPTAAPELLTQSFVRPDRRIRRPRQTRRAVYELRVADGPLPELASAGAQRVEQRGAAARITVELGSSPPVEDVDRAELLRATTYLPHRDPEIRRLLAQATGGRQLAGDAARAEALRAFVADYVVDKDLDTVLATAAEVAATRSGDCTEHAVLLAALLRAADIPARVVSGLIYVERFAGAAEIFGYHMWTQALLDGRWIDLDATLPQARFDASHIAFATSSFGDDQSVLKEIARIVPLMGQVQIEVLEVGY